MGLLNPWVLIPFISVCVIGVGALLWAPVRAGFRRRQVEQAIRLFRLQRERLEARQKAHDEGRWVRAAAEAYAAKHNGGAGTKK